MNEESKDEGWCEVPLASFYICSFNQILPTPRRRHMTQDHSPIIGSARDAPLGAEKDTEHSPQLRMLHKCNIPPISCLVAVWTPWPYEANTS